MEIQDLQVKEETGFSAIEMLLCIIIVLMIGFIGLYVYHTQKATNDTYASASKIASASAPKVTKKTQANAVDVTANWLLYTSPNKEYQLRLADGWKLSRNVTTLNSFMSGDSLVPQAGTKAIVTDSSVSSDGSEAGLSIVFYNNNQFGSSYSDYAQLPDLKTESGITIKAYKTTITQNDLVGGSLQKGATSYAYVIVSADKRVVIEYNVNLSDPDFNSTVQQVAKTVVIN